MVSLLYDQDACLPSHKDDGLPGIGLSISLGAAATFAYGDETICLRSGDALFGRFGHVTHQVSAIHGARRRHHGGNLCRWHNQNLSL